MRSFLRFIVFVTLLVAVIAVVVVPVVARPLVADRVRAVSPFVGRLDVDVEVDAIGLLRGRIERIRVRGSDLASGDVRIGALDLTVMRVSMTDQSFEDISGTLSAIVVPSSEGATITIDRVSLSGSSEAMVAVASLDEHAGLALIGTAFADAGMAVEGLRLVNNGIAFRVAGQTVQVPLAVDLGALVVPNLFGTAPLMVLEPGRDDPWRLSHIAVTQNGMTIEAAIDGEALLAGG